MCLFQFYQGCTCRKSCKRNMKSWTRSIWRMRTRKSNRNTKVMTKVGPCRVDLCQAIQPFFLNLFLSEIIAFLLFYFTSACQNWPILSCITYSLLIALQQLCLGDTSSSTYSSSGASSLVSSTPSSSLSVSDCSDDPPPPTAFVNGSPNDTPGTEVSRKLSKVCHSCAIVLLKFFINFLY